ncbi:tryptophan halogenase family protein [Ideonella sp. BN130291]|uniref:tryptophan halogenase family protein n=1 Tax=Ideonella sp. BN130291 TaxID=3112940 RepID=UPI002E2687A5|nr:tryptophan halogenase family protein [Ideonella sp. BN130291]
MSDQPVAHVVILGGGSAGWLTAGLIAAQHRHRLRVTVIEAPDIAPIGVGEGTWPTMRDSLRSIGVSESDFVRECEATFKQGSLFRRWVDGSADDLYFHPFMLPQGWGDAPLAQAWQQHAGTRFADCVSVQPHLCQRGRAPKQFATPEYAGVANYGYHFDAGRFGPFLRTHCVKRLGVHHVADQVVAVLSHDNGDIAALQTRSHGAIAGDLFIDCSGLKAHLLAGHYGVPFVSHKHVLFCDAALALQVPYADPQAPIASQTVSTAQSHGWVWDIGLQTRRGVGLVYSSSHCDDETAHRTLMDHIARSGANGTAAVDLPQPRQLRFEPGHRRTFWHRNCVAIGLSAGFLEPLEASALALVEYSAELLRQQMPATRGAMELLARRFNEACSYRWARIVDFLKLHYVLSRRTDSAFWLDNRQPASVPEPLRELLALWRHLPPSRHDLVRHDEAFPAASYQYILYGMGWPGAASCELPAQDIERAQGCFREAAELTRKMLAALPSHRDLIEHIRRHGLSRI